MTHMTKLTVAHTIADICYCLRILLSQFQTRFMTHMIKLTVAHNSTAEMCHCWYIYIYPLIQNTIHDTYDKVDSRTHDCWHLLLWTHMIKMTVTHNSTADIFTVYVYIYILRFKTRFMTHMTKSPVRNNSKLTVTYNSKLTVTYNSTPDTFICVSQIVFWIWGRAVEGGGGGGG